MHEVLLNCSGPKLITYRVNAGPQSRESWVYDPAHAQGRIIGEVCHFVDLFRYLTGEEPVGIHAQALGDASSAIRLENIAATLEFSGGSLATLTYTAEGSPLVGKERIEVFCDGTAMTMDDFKSLTIRGRERVDIKARRPDKGHRAELNHFFRTILGSGSPVIVLEDGIIATRICGELVENARRSVCEIEPSSAEPSEGKTP